MRTFFLTLFFSFLTSLLVGQATIKYETTLLDYGQVFFGTEGKREIRFTNIGNEPLIIIDAKTSDGGSMATFPREPIGPGNSGVIVFHYDTKRVGKFEKCISINSNTKPSSNGCAIKVIGEVIWPKTSININSQEKNIGTLNFGDVDSVQFEITNTGKENLHLYRISSPGIDLLWYKILSKDSVIKNSKFYVNNNDVYYGPNETIVITALIKNAFGNIGLFEKQLALRYNSHDTLILKIVGNYIGKPIKNKVYEGPSVFFYDDNRLLKIESYLATGKIVREEFYEGSNCIHKKYYGFYKNELKTEEFYKNGVLIETKNYKIDDY